MSMSANQQPRPDPKSLEGIILRIQSIKQVIRMAEDELTLLSVDIPALVGQAASASKSEPPKSENKEKTEGAAEA